MTIPKLIGELVAVPGGWSVRITRYGSGRRLAQPRFLATPDGQPFASRLAALDALTAWRDEPRSCRQVRLPPEPVTSCNAKVVKRSVPPLANHAQDYELEHKTAKARERRRKAAERKARNLPAVEKLLPERPAQVVRPVADYGDAPVTRIAPFERRNLTLRRRWSGQIGRLVG